MFFFSLYDVYRDSFGFGSGNKSRPDYIDCVVLDFVLFYSVKFIGEQDDDDDVDNDDGGDDS